MIHVFGMQNYADVMSNFAAGERYINRVWSASTDGYEDEVRAYLVRALDQFREVFGPDRQVSVSRELSKLYGETIRGTLDSVAEHFKKNAPKGEFVLVVRGADS